MKTLKEIEEYNSGSIITVVMSEHESYPTYFVNDEYLGWAEYLDTSNFNPFERLGFTETYVRIDVNSNYENREEAEMEITDAVSSGKQLTQVIKELSVKEYINIEQ